MPEQRLQKARATLPEGYQFPSVRKVTMLPVWHGSRLVYTTWKGCFHPTLTVYAVRPMRATCS